MKNILTSSMCEELHSNFECNPPSSCFTCPFPDCITSKVIITKLETKFLKAGAGVQSKKRRYKK